MKRLLAPLLLIGCQQAEPSLQEQRTSRENDLTLVNPAGRYQMLPLEDDKAGVYLLDTRHGRVRVCPRINHQIVCDAPTGNDGQPH